ncbi:TPA: hypothetical protein HA251_06065 [Candidatus Woesearchaeota archaeon]|nr:hypothetical protein [Candidatus Woesearchaeota archaeon]
MTHAEKRYEINKGATTLSPGTPAFKILVERDFTKLSKRVHLAIEQRLRPELLLQSITGHAMNGHGAFFSQGVSGPRRCPNADLYEIIQGMRGDGAEKSLALRQRVVDDVRTMLARCSNGQSQAPCALSYRGRPLAGVNGFLDEAWRVERPLDIVRGFLFGVAIDNFDWRREVQSTHGLEMGGGEMHAVDFAALRATGLTLELLASIPFELEAPVRREGNYWLTREGDGFAWLLNEGVVLTRKKHYVPSNAVRPAYVRLIRGQGVSDDASVIMGGFLYGPDFAKGVLLADAIDTWEKATPLAYPHGQDEHIAAEVRSDLTRRLKRAPWRKDELVDFIYLCAIDPRRATIYPDCSQRRFLEYHSVDGRPAARSSEHTYALEQHFRFAQWLRGFVDKQGSFDADRARTSFSSTKTPDIKISFTEVSLHEFYLEIINRIEGFQAEHGSIGLRMAR